MAVFYSPSVRGFFSPDGRPPIPSDAVEISDEQHANLIAGQTTGREIVPDESGFPALVSPMGPTPEQVQAANIANAKYIGVEFDGIMCSATTADQNGLMAVFLSIQIQGASFVPTRFSFENGSELIITLSNYQAFMDVWLPFRQSFFAA